MRWRRSSQRRSQRSSLFGRCAAGPRWVFRPSSGGPDAGEARRFRTRAYISPALPAQPVGDEEADQDCQTPVAFGPRPLFLARKAHTRLADGQIARIENLWHNVRTVAKFEIDEVWLTIFQFVEGWCFNRVCLDVGEFVVMVDCGDRERLLVALEPVSEAQRDGIFRAVSVNLAGNGLRCGSSAVAALFFGQLDLSAIVLDLIRGNEPRRAIHGGSHGIFFELHEHL